MRGSRSLGAWEDVDTSTPIFVLRLSLAEFQHGVLGIARSAGRLGVPVYAVRRDAREPATRSRYIVGGFAMPETASEEQWLDAVMRLGEHLGRAVLIAIDDNAAVFVADHHRQLSERFLVPHQPNDLARRLSSKRELWELCQRFAIPTPSASLPTRRQELLDYAAEQGYPVVLKRSDPWLPARRPHAPSVFIARTRAELLHAYDWMESPQSPNVMLQEFIPGDADSVWMFNGYFGADSTCLCAFTGRKLRQYRPRVGPTSLGVCETNDEIIILATRLMREIGYRGIVDMGFRYDSSDGLYKLLDVNPRIGSTFRLFVGDGQLDVLRAQYLDLTGHPVPSCRALEGRKWIVEPMDLASVAQLGRERELPLSSWVRSLRGIDEAAWWATDDPVPFLTMCTRLMPYVYSLTRRQIANPSRSAARDGASLR